MHGKMTILNKRCWKNYHSSNESSASTHICIVPSRYNFAYSSGLSIASAFNAQSDPCLLYTSTIDYPPRINNAVNNSVVSEKSKDEMSLDEYKQWVMNQISQFPVSGWVRSTFSSGSIVIKEEAFERMKNEDVYKRQCLQSGNEFLKHTMQRWSQTEKQEQK